jgi:PAS domain S-box-containing protein
VDRFLDPASDGVVVFDRYARLRFASPAAVALLGYDPSAIVGMHALEFVHPDDAEFASAALARLSTGRSQVADLRVRCASGAVLPVEVAARPYLAKGRLQRFVLVLRDLEDLGREPAAHPTASGDGYLELDRSGGLAVVSRRYLELFGLDDEEIAHVQSSATPLGRRAATMAAAASRVADPAAFVASLSRHLQLSGEVSFEDIQLLDGRTLERYAAPIRDEGGNITGRALFMCDVTARRRGDAELRERARQQAAVADLGELALNAETPEPLLTLAVRLVASTLGVDLVQILELDPKRQRFALRAASADDPFPAEGVPAGARSMSGFTLLQQATQVFLDLRTETRFEAPQLIALGMVSSVSVVMRSRERPFGVLAAFARRPRAFSDGEVHFLETVANVVSAMLARHTAEQMLLSRERQLRAVFENTLDALTLCDDDGRLVDVNPAACRLFARTRAELLTLHARELFTAASRDRATAQALQAAREGRASAEVEVERPGLPPRQAEATAVGNILPGLHLGLLRDVTEERALQARLALTDRMASVGTLAAGVAHELNNPLSYVTANLSWLGEILAGRAQRVDVTQADLRQAVEDARSGAERMRQIIRDLRTFSRGDETRLGEVRVEPVLESCISVAWNEIRHRARLVRDFRGVPTVHGNEARLGQVFLNLIVNAAQSIPEGAADRNEIRITVRSEGERVAVEVKDTGGGIAHEHRARIFDPFFTTKPPGVGTGLGLSICHNLVTAMGGAIEVESEPSQGALFRVLLKVWSGTPEEPEAGPPPAAAPARRGRILVVDDEALVAAAIRRALATEHDVTVVLGAREALARIEAEPFDLVVSDLLMPEQTGIDLWRTLEARHPELARSMVFVTGGAFTPSSRAFVDAHREACLDKPFELEALRALIRARLAHRG